MLRERSFHTCTINLNVAEGPENGPPLVLIHGGSGRWQTLNGIIPDFVEEWHVYAPDLRGHGKSDHAPNGYRMDDFADDIAAFLESLPEPAAIFGHSLGGQVGLMAAACVPERVHALIIGDSPFLNNNLSDMFARERHKLETWMQLCGKPMAEIVTGLKEMLLIHGGNPQPRKAREIFGEDSTWYAFMAENLSTHDANFLRTLLEDFEQLNAAYQVEQLLPCITCPMLILQGDPASGGLMTQDEIDLGLRLLPNGHHIRLDGIGHGLHFEDKGRVVEVLKVFLGKYGKE
jgi:pimeloyl-ACP methyl ester carboxylesterase